MDKGIGGSDMMSSNRSGYLQQQVYHQTPIMINAMQTDRTTGHIVELDIPDSITRPVEDEDNDFRQPIVQM